MFSLFNRTNNIEKIKNLGVGKVSNKEIVNSLISLEDAEKNLEKEDYKRVYDLYKIYNYQSFRVSMDLENLYSKAGSILLEFEKISKTDSYTKNETIFSSKSQKEKYLNKAFMLYQLKIYKKMEIEAKENLKGASEEKAMELYKNNLITEEEKNKYIDAIQLLQFNLDFCPSQIKYLEEELKKLENDIDNNVKNKKSKKEDYENESDSMGLLSKLVLGSFLLIVGYSIANVYFGAKYDYNEKQLRERIEILEEENDKLTEENTELYEEINELNSTLYNITGLHTNDYIINKLKFIDDNIVFVLQGYGNYYYTYDCVQKITDGPYTYWAYNKEAARSKGYYKGTC